MNELKVGDNLELHCYKHNGKINSTSDRITILDIKDDYIVCGDYKTTITDSDGSTRKTKEPAIMFFYKNRWFNVLAQFKKQGLFYYCNIATPYLIDDKIIKYIDYDLDLRVFPDGGFKILDKNEYNYHKKIMHYSDELDKIVKSELSSLIELKRANKGPFDKNIVNEYYEEYIKIAENL